jgi:hypothetical protein
MDVVPRHIIIRRGLLCLAEHVLPMSLSSYGNAAGYDRVRDDRPTGADLFSHSPLCSSYRSPAAGNDQKTIHSLPCVVQARMECMRRYRKNPRRLAFAGEWFIRITINAKKKTRASPARGISVTLPVPPRMAYYRLPYCLLSSIIV